MFKKYFGDRNFYLKVSKLAIPRALSMLLSSCMTIIDSIMVSSIGMVTAVGNAFNVVSLHDYLLWGIEAGISTFSAQYYGAGQYKNMSRSHGLSIILTMFTAGVWFLVIMLFGRNLLLFFLNDPVIVEHSFAYLKIMGYSLFPYGLFCGFNVMYNSIHNSKLTFYVSLMEALINVILNYVLIFIVSMGVRGAALGTLIANLCCVLFYVIYTLKTKPVFYNGIKAMFELDREFIMPIMEKIYPIAFNEFLFGFGMSLFNKAYGMLGSRSMEAIYVAGEIFSLFLFMVWGYGGAVSVLTGTLLGEGKIEEAKKESKYHLGLSFIIGTLLCILMITMAPLFLNLYSVSDEITRLEARQILMVYGLKAFFRTYTYVMFSTLKAGGDSRIVQFLDSGIMYAVGLPIAFLSVLIGIKSAVIVILLCQIEQLVRTVFTLKRYNSHKWAVNLTV